MFYLFFGLTVLVMISQTVHSYFVFEMFSKIENKNTRQFQSVMFCSILSIGILGFVWIGKPNLAILGALIEIVVNIFYYASEFWMNGFKSFQGDPKEIKSKKTKSVLKFWRINWIAIFFGVLLPVLIYVFAEQMKQLNEG